MRFDATETQRRQSESIGQLITALVEAQKKITNPKKGSKNPFFSSTYADLAACADVCRAPLADNGLTILAFPSAYGSNVSVETMLVHTSGEWISATLTAEARKEKKGEGSIPDNGAQSIAATVTYLRRAGLSSLVFLTPENEDDDGNRAEGQEPVKVQKERYEIAAEAFRKLGVTITMLETQLKHPIHTTTDDEYTELEAVYRAIRDDKKPVSDFFGPTTVPQEPAAIPASPETPPVNHTPAEGKAELRPGDRKRGRPPKKAAEQPNTISTTDYSNGITTTIADFHATPTETSNVNETAETLNRPATPEEKRAIRPKLNEYQQLVGSEPLKAFILKSVGVKDTSEITKAGWDSVLTKLDEAKTSGGTALADLVSGK